MPKFKVKSVAFNLLSDALTPPHTPMRVEEVDTDTNPIFEGCTTIQQVEITYEAFWNYLNSPNEVHKPEEKVKVLSVEPV